MTAPPLTPEDKRRLLKRGQQDPVWWIENVLGDKGWRAQYDIIEAVRDHRHVAVKSCHSIGKDWISARVALWFLCNHDPSVVITTGPSDRQVKVILWRELAKAHGQSRWPLGGKVLVQELRLAEDRYALGFATTGDPERFSGFHSPNILVIVDESSGVPQVIHDAISGILSSQNAYKLDISNPTDPTSEFAQFFKRPGIHKISVSAFDTPNFTEFGITQEDIEKDTWRDKITGDLPMPMLISPEWVAERYRTWGKDNPWYISRVEAQFAESAEDALIPMHLIEAAQNRTLEPGQPHVLGVDVARYGDDKSVIAERKGPVVRILKKFGKVDTMTTTGHVRLTRREVDADMSIVDEIGVGAGVVDRLRELREPVQAANAAEAAVDKERFVNARAEWAWTVRQALERGEMDLDPADEELAAQLADIKWKPTSGGKIQIESKDDIKKRSGASPDEADALFHTYAGQSELVQKYKKAMQSIGA